MTVAFRRHTPLPLDDGLYALQPSIPHLTRSSLHRCLQRHSISRLPDMDGDRPKRQKFKRYPIGFFHVDLAEVRIEEGRWHATIIARDAEAVRALSRTIGVRAFSPGAPEREIVDRRRPRRQGSQRDTACLTTFRQVVLETMERLSRPKSH